MQFSVNYGMGSNKNYITGMKPLLKKKALYSDTTSNYVSPMEPSPYGIVTIKFRTAKNNADKVLLVSEGKSHYMEIVESNELFDYYSHDIQLEDKIFSYHFEVYSGNMMNCYDVRGVSREPMDDYNFVIIPGFKTPDWAKGAVMYQIYVDRFFNGDKTNDVESREYSYIGDYTSRVDDWNKYPAVMGVREFYGGDLQGVIDKMDYLEGLGIEVIYFNPLFVSPSNHKYDIQDYDNIVPHFGKIVSDGGEVLPEGDMENRHATKYIKRVTDKANLDASNELFAKVVEEAHKRGIKVILDGVFNHCGSFNKWLDRERIYEDAEGYEKGAYITGDSPYRNYFKFYDESKWPYNHTYDGWWGHDTLPKLNYEASQELYNYILDIGRKWVSPPYNADGWRLDVAADLGHSPEFNHKFWRDFRQAVKQANPNALILAEHYGDPKSWLMGDQWDSVMNYDAFMEPVTWFLTGMQKHSDDFRNDQLNNAASFWGAMMHHNARFAMPSMMVAMNELSNHDHSRFLTRTNRRIGRVNNLGPEAANEGVSIPVMREAVLLQMTWIGAPTVYYGDEAGVCGFTDPDNRRTYPWGNENKELIEFHKKMISIRKRYSEFKTGSIKYVGEDFGYIAYGRFNSDGQSLILINNSDESISKDITVWTLGIPKDATMTRLMMTDDYGFDDTPIEYKLDAGHINVILPKHSGMVLRHEGTLL